MMETLWQKITYASRQLIPTQPHRLQLTWRTAPTSFSYFVPFLFMAYLVRRRNTRVLRLLLLPIVLVMALRGTFGYDWNDPQLALFTWVRGLVGLAVCAISIDFALEKEDGRKKVGERTLPAIGEASFTGKVTVNGHSNHTSDGTANHTTHSRPSILPPCVGDTLEVAFALRGIGWEFGRSVPIPPSPPSHSHSRSTFLLHTALTFLRTTLLLDTLDLLQKLVPGVGSTSGGSIFFRTLPPFQTYLLSTAITTGTGWLMITGFENLYALASLLGVGLLGQEPEEWPPLMGNPWAAHSLSDFWGRRWHQALRRSFVVVGGWVPGKAGMVLGTFVASGMMHEGAMWLMGRGMDWRVVLFFGMQGVGVVCERGWRRVMGRRVRGGWGRVWTYVNVLVWAQICVDSWYMRGLGGTVVVPPNLSISRRLLLPILRPILPSGAVAL